LHKLEDTVVESLWAGLGVVAENGIRISGEEIDGRRGWLVAVLVEGIRNDNKERGTLLSPSAGASTAES